MRVWNTSIVDINIHLLPVKTLPCPQICYTGEEWSQNGSPSFCILHPGRILNDCGNKYTSILSMFLFSVIRTRFKRVHKSKLNCKKVKILKKTKPGVLSRKLRRPVLVLNPPNLCCEEKLHKFSQDNYLVMGHLHDNNLVPSFIMKWLAKSSKVCLSYKNYLAY